MLVFLVRALNELQVASVRMEVLTAVCWILWNSGGRNSEICMRYA